MTSLIDPYVLKNKDFITSHKLKTFLEDQWTYKLKYVDCIVPPYRLRNPKGLEVSEALLIGQAVDDYLTHGESYFRENYIVVSQRVTDVQGMMIKAQNKANSFKDQSCKGANEARQKVGYYNNMIGKVQLTESMMFAISECVLEAKEQSMFSKEYNKAVIQHPLEGFNMVLRGELDHLSEDKKVIRDLKTTASLDTFKPEWYTLQMAFYHFLVEEVYGIRAEVYLDVIEKPAPRKPFSRSICVKYTELTLLKERRRLMEGLIAMKKAHESEIYTFPDSSQQLKSEFYGYDGYGRPTEFIPF